MYNYNSYHTYGYRNYNHGAEADAIAGMSIAFLLVFVLVVAIIGYVISSLLYMLIFKKAGIEAKKAWIPFYNRWIFFELGGQEGWKSLLTFIPYVGFIISLVFEVMAVVEISKKLGKSPYWAILFPLGYLTFGITTLIWYLTTALSNNQWNDAAGKESLAKGTILGYKIVEEDKETEETEAKEEKTEE